LSPRDVLHTLTVAMSFIIPGVPLAVRRARGAGLQQGRFPPGHWPVQPVARSGGGEVAVRVRCALLRRKRTGQRADGIRPLSPEYDARVAAPRPSRCVRRSDDTEAFCRSTVRVPVPSGSPPGTRSPRLARSHPGRQTRRSRGFATRSDRVPPYDFAGHWLQGRRSVRPPPDRSADGPIAIPVEIQAISSQIIGETSDGPHSYPPWTPAGRAAAHRLAGGADEGVGNGRP
jgi:hypothetical protein